MDYDQLFSKLSLDDSAVFQRYHALSAVTPAQDLTTATQQLEALRKQSKDLERLTDAFRKLKTSQKYTFDEYKKLRKVTLDKERAADRKSGVPEPWWTVFQSTPGLQKVKHGKAPNVSISPAQRSMMQDVAAVQDDINNITAYWAKFIVSHVKEDPDYVVMAQQLQEMQIQLTRLQGEVVQSKLYDNERAKVSHVVRQLQKNVHTETKKQTKELDNALGAFPKAAMILAADEDETTYRPNVCCFMGTPEQLNPPANLEFKEELLPKMTEAEMKTQLKPCGRPAHICCPRCRVRFYCSTAHFALDMAPHRRSTPPNTCMRWDTNIVRLLQNPTTTELFTVVIKQTSLPGASWNLSLLDVMLGELYALSIEANRLTTEVASYMALLFDRVYASRVLDAIAVRPGSRSIGYSWVGPILPKVRSTDPEPEGLITNAEYKEGYRAIPEARLQHEWDTQYANLQTKFLTQYLLLYRLYTSEAAAATASKNVVKGGKLVKKQTPKVTWKQMFDQAIELGKDVHVGEDPKSVLGTESASLKTLLQLLSTQQMGNSGCTGKAFHFQSQDNAARFCFEMQVGLQMKAENIQILGHNQYFGAAPDRYTKYTVDIIKRACKTPETIRVDGDSDMSCTTVAFTLPLLNMVAENAVKTDPEHEAKREKAVEFIEKLAYQEGAVGVAFVYKLHTTSKKDPIVYWPAPSGQDDSMDVKDYRELIAGTGSNHLHADEEVYPTKESMEIKAKRLVVLFSQASRPAEREKAEKLIQRFKQLPSIPFECTKVVVEPPIDINILDISYAPPRPGTSDADLNQLAEDDVLTWDDVIRRYSHAMNRHDREVFQELSLISTGTEQNSGATMYWKCIEGFEDAIEDEPVQDEDYIDSDVTSDDEYAEEKKQSKAVDLVDGYNSEVPISDDELDQLREDAEIYTGRTRSGLIIDTDADAEETKEDMELEDLGRYRVKKPKMKAMAFVPWGGVRKSWI